MFGGDDEVKRVSTTMLARIDLLVWVGYMHSVNGRISRKWKVSGPAQHWRG